MEEATVARVSLLRQLWDLWWRLLACRMFPPFPPSTFSNPAKVRPGVRVYAPLCKEAVARVARNLAKVTRHYKGFSPTLDASL